MLTSKQSEFCKQVANGKNATQAYKASFKTKSAATCKVNASKLLKQSAIQGKIRELQSLAKDIVAKSRKKVMEKAILKEVMDVNERQSILTQIARGEIKLKKLIVVDKVVEEWDVVPDWMDRKNAISELNKMDGAYPPQKSEITFPDKPEIIAPGDGNS